MGRVTPVLEPKTLEIVALVAAGVALLAVVVATVAVYQIWSIRRRVLLLQKDSQGDSFIDVVAHKVTEVQGLRADVQALRSDVAVLRTEVRDAPVRRVWRPGWTVVILGGGY